ncbi:glycosyl transferase [Odoribacter laneus]|nr:glycosyl transferase [Odoribacter laneus]GKI25382.1 glycosyl transferase [Odoribacter laneus]
MESRNLVTAREMVEYNNWLVPTMNGDLRLEKPPLPTWVAAGMEFLSPDNILLQRAAAGIIATLLVFFLYFLSVKLTRSRLYGLMAALILCTSVNIILMGRTATWDIYCHSFMLGAIYFLFRGFEEEGPRWKDFIGAGVLMGLSFLGKGPVSFYALLLPFLISYFAIYRPSVRKKGGPILIMVLLCLVISLWWPAYLYVYHRDMALYIADKESTAWLQHNVRPWYYYWKFFLESGIWSLFLLTALIWPYWKRRMSLKKEYALTVSWTLTILILLSFLPEKKSRYLLPILIPGAMVVAHLFYFWVEKIRMHLLSRSDKIIFKINAFLICLAVVALPVAVYLLFYSEGLMSTALFIVITLLFIWALWFLIRSAWKVRPLSFLWGIVFLFLMVEISLMPFIAHLFNNREMKSIREVRNIEELNTLPFYYPLGEELRIELVYEAGKRILPLDLKNDSLVRECLPFVLVSREKAENILKTDTTNRLQLEQIDVYDDNHRPKGTRWYSDLFVRYVTKIEATK